MKLNRKGRRRSLSSKYIFIYILGQLALIFMLIQSFVWLSGELFKNQHFQIIQSKSDGLVEYYELEGEAKLTELLAYRLKKKSADNIIYLLTDENYQPIMGNVPEWPERVPKDVEFGEVDWNFSGENDFLDLTFFNRTLDDGKHLLIGQTDEYVRYYGVRFRMMSFGTLIATVLIGMAIGWFLHHQLQKRFRVIEETCEKISEGQLSYRMEHRAKGDEVDRIAETFNLMLDRIEQLMGGIQHVTNNIAHDLRTPLTRLRGRLELLEGRMAQGEDRQELMASIQDIDDLLSTFQSLLNISRMESGQIKKDFTTIDLAHLSEDVIELYEPLAEVKSQQIIFEGCENPTIIGDQDLLFQCLANILDNAIKYAPKDTFIQVSLKQVGQHLEVSVKDQGSGIAPQEFEKVFERFYRIEASRNEKGNGLGLSVVAAIAELHHASIKLENDHGLTVKIRFPSA